MVFWNSFYEIFRDYPLNYTRKNSCSKNHTQFEQTWMFWFLLVLSLVFSIVISLLFLKMALDRKKRRSRMPLSSPRGTTIRIEEEWPMPHVFLELRTLVHTWAWCYTTSKPLSGHGYKLQKCASLWLLLSYEEGIIRRIDLPIFAFKSGSSDSVCNLLQAWSVPYLSGKITSTNKST